MMHTAEHPLYTIGKSSLNFTRNVVSRICRFLYDAIDDDKYIRDSLAELDSPVVKE